MYEFVRTVNDYPAAALAIAVWLVITGVLSGYTIDHYTRRKR